MYSLKEAGWTAYALHTGLTSDYMRISLGMFCSKLSAWQTTDNTDYVAESTPFMFTGLIAF